MEKNTDSGHSMELWDAYYPDGTPAGCDLIRGEKIPENLRHMVAEASVMHRDGDILLMQRDFDKPNYPGFRESGAGGSVLKGESMAEQKNVIYLTQAETKRLQTLERRYKNAARAKLEARTAYYHTITGGRYTSITVRDQKTRWGSCSSRGTLSFNYRLIFAPPRVLDYVVVHELCHLTHMNHSKDFWNMVASVMPDYKLCKNWLKEHGHELTLENHLQKQGIPVTL